MTNKTRLRLAEWACSLVLLAIGFISLINPETFGRPALSLFAENATVWTLLCVLVGSVRIISLVVNGHWRGGTPGIRLVGSFVGAAMFGALAGNLLGSAYNDPHGISWGVGTYGVLMLVELINCYFSASDVANVKKYGG